MINLLNNSMLELLKYHLKIINPIINILLLIVEVYLYKGVVKIKLKMFRKMLKKVVLIYKKIVIVIVHLFLA